MFGLFLNNLGTLQMWIFNGCGFCAHGCYSSVSILVNAPFVVYLLFDYISKQRNPVNQNFDQVPKIWMDKCVTSIILA